MLARVHGPALVERCLLAWVARRRDFRLLQGKRPRKIDGVWGSKQFRVSLRGVSVPYTFSMRGRSNCTPSMLFRQRQGYVLATAALPLLKPFWQLRRREAIVQELVRRKSTFNHTEACRRLLRVQKHPFTIPRASR